MFKNILIIGHSNIGDVCYDLVVVNPLRKYFPQAKISFLTSSRAENILQGYEGLDKVFTFDRYAKDSGLRGRLRLMAALARERFDLALVLKNTLMYKFLGIPCVWSVKKYLGYEPSEKKIHIVDIYLEFLRYHGIDAQEATFGFALGEEEKNFCSTFLAEEGISAKDRVVGILPVANWSLKSWPIDKWNELAGILKSQYGIKVINLSKSSSDSFSQMVLKNISRKIISADKTTLKQALALIKRCNLFIGPDSSLLHLASCIGVEAIGFYGPTSGEYFYPYFHRHNIVVSKEKLDCMPCYPGLKSCLCKEKLQYGVCMEGISVKDVLELVRQKLDL
ncbi:MAG: glycosyltransferase family 9 protein [Candidatus Omnitrophica bacterium]|nr:glycosyltransferase family 9 protein [Candidatus Omnitrophota bacterium]MBU1924403.1 glycosyltransferase family 9 protein [Candidatus Omnitrophota bacterium]